MGEQGMTEQHTGLVSAEWLAERLDDPQIVILDASFFLPAQNRNAREEYRSTHLPGARFFDIDEVADRESSLPHMLPPPHKFAKAAGALGIGNETTVVVYDSNYYMASARAWWTFRVFGHERVAVLDGGLGRWQALGLPVEDRPVSPLCRGFDAGFRAELVRGQAQILGLNQQPAFQLLDARSSGRFEGIEAEPRAGLRSGHIPGSRNLFFRELVDESSLCLKPPDALSERFRRAGIDPQRPVVTSCGTGVTAAILAFGLYQIGNRDVAVYDGSWTEWGSLSDAPVETGPAL
jgi:thiosulfate/3-mercaptopyruvate sulfurtransferase